MDLAHNYKVKRTDSSDAYFGKLVVLLDKDLGENYIVGRNLFYYKYKVV